MSYVGPTPVRVPAWVLPVMIATVGLAVVTLLAFVDPEVRTRWSPGCPFRAATGLDCPGCGATRAMYALLSGDPLTAANHNVMLLVALPWLAWAYVRWTLVRVGKMIAYPRVRPAAAWTITGLVASFALVRNVPLWPLSWLGSTPT